MAQSQEDLQSSTGASSLQSSQSALKIRSLKFIKSLSHLDSEVKLNPAVKKKTGGTAYVHQGNFGGEVVAVKIPIHACSLNQKQFKEFLRELDVMANVKHPNCVMLLAACEDRNEPFLVMEWMHGGNLHEALGKDDPDALPLHVRLRIAREIASAIEYLHRCQIYHGDLKSLNVLLTSDLVSKICDFGAAIQRLNTIATQSSRTDHAASLQLTPLYCAPELFQGEKPNAKSDIYAFGMIMYELLTCKLPFEGVKPDLLPTIICNGGRPEVPDPMDPHTSKFPPAFFDVMQRCWHPDPAFRPTAEFVHEILVSIDPSARPSAPLVLYPVGHAAPLGSVLEYLRAAMPTGVETMLSHMMDRADSMFKSDIELQSLCAKYSISLSQAHSIMVFSLSLTLPIQSNGSCRFTLWTASSLVSVPKTLLTIILIQPADSVMRQRSSVGQTSRTCFARH
jgi:serine/threonine protein kinase